MGISKIYLAAFLLGMIGTSLAQSSIEKRAICEDPRPTFAYSNKTLAEHEEFLRANNIFNVSKNPIDTKHLEEFLFEYEKFPAPLRTEMVQEEAYIHILSGSSITEDPSWKKDETKTFDNRDWSNIAGGGGQPFTRKGIMKHASMMKRYCKNNRSTCEAQGLTVPTEEIPHHPTRIVINKIHPDEKTKKLFHGSVNLVLHEHGHTLDNLYGDRGISNSPEWVSLTDEPEIKAYMKVVCKDPGYCLNNHNEAFAELLAYHFACESSRSHMERNAPELAAYFKRLESAKSRKQRSKAAK